MKQLILTIPLLLILISCGEEIPTPKPPTYLRPELPAPEYRQYKDECNYSFKLNDLYTVEKESNGVDSTQNCHRKIQLGPLNGTVFFSFMEVREPLAFYVNTAIDKVEEHQIKASNIKDQRIIRTDSRVFGTFFELEGDVATPFQFYLTDSTDRFVYGQVLFNSRPNYDSLKPTLDYLKKDLDTLINTFEWISE